MNEIKQYFTFYFMSNYKLFYIIDFFYKLKTEIILNFVGD